jgi:hypothetical protein
MPEYKFINWNGVKVFTASTDAHAKDISQKSANHDGGITTLYRMNKKGLWKKIKKIKPRKPGLLRARNPALALPRNKWVNAKVQITSGGKILAQIGSPVLAMKKKRKNTRRRKH